MKLLSFPLAAAFAAVLSLSACGGGGGAAPSPAAPPTGNGGVAGNDNPGNSGTEILLKDTTVGTGATAVKGNRVLVNYTGWLYSATAADYKGTQFDTSIGTGRAPIEFTVGATNIIPGFSAGVEGMKVGGKRTVFVPASLAYGAAGQPPVIPGNAALMFDLELVKVCGATC